MYTKVSGGAAAEGAIDSTRDTVRYTDAGLLLALLCHSRTVICKMQSISLGNSLRVIYYYLTIPMRYKKSKLLPPFYR